MAKKMQSNSKNGIARKSQAKPRCAALFERGITNSVEFLNATTATIADLACSRLGPTVGNAMFAGQRNILKMLELQQRHGIPQSTGETTKILAIGK